MTDQEVFDKVATHLLTQGKKSEIANTHSFGTKTICAYRGENGLKCAVGCMIPDELYDPIMESSFVLLMSDLQRHKSCLREVIGDDRAEELLEILSPSRFLLNRLQQVHDTVDPDCWEATLRVLADECGLSPAVLRKKP